MTRPRLAWLARLALTVALLALVFSVIPLSEALHSLASARLPLVAAALGLLMLMRWIAAVRMKRLTDEHGIDLSVAQLVQIGLASSFYGFLLPGTLSGGLVRWAKIQQRGTTAGRALAAILVDRWVHTLVLAALGAALFAMGTAPAAFAPLGLGLVAVAAGLALAAAVALSPLAERPWVARLPSRLPTFLGSRVGDLVAAMRQYRSPSRPLLASALALSFGAHLVGIASFVALARALDLGPSAIDLGWVRACLLLAAVLPISVAGIGVREGTLLVLLSPLGVAGPEAVALSLLDFACLLVMVALGGVWEAFALRPRGRPGASERPPSERQAQGREPVGEE